MFKKLKNWVIKCVSAVCSFFVQSTNSTPASTPRSSASKKDASPRLLFFPQHVSDEKPTNTSGKDSLEDCLNHQIRRLREEQKSFFATPTSEEIKQNKISALEEIKSKIFPNLITENSADEIDLESVLTDEFSKERKHEIISILRQASFFSRTQRALVPYGLPKPCRVN